MIQLIDFTNYPQQFSRTYGGASGRKYDIKYNGENWFLKFPGNIKEQVTGMSYSNSSVSEYIGSKIYESIGIDVHETLLGIFRDKCVVACKDFVGDDEFPVTGFGELKTTFIPAFLDSQGNETNGNGTDFDEILKTMNEHPVLKKYPEIKERFWDMFIVDALIGNNDRNNGNWGLIKNRDYSYRLSPVFDNGSSFLPKTSDDKLKKMLEDASMINNAAYSGYFCVFTLNGHKMNPLKYIESMENEACNGAVKRIVSEINLEKIDAIINEIPNSFKNVEIISETSKEVYRKLIHIRYDKVMLPTYKKIQTKEDFIKSFTEETEIKSLKRKPRR